MNKKYIDVLFKYNKTGTIIKLIKDNVHNWSIDDFHYVYFKSHNCYGIIYEYLINMFQKRNNFENNKIIYLSFDRVRSSSMARISSNILKYYIYRYSNTNIMDKNIRSILCNIIYHGIRYKYDNKKYILENYLYLRLLCNDFIMRILKNTNINKFYNILYK